MSEKEHPARTAGRYVRAAGIAFKKERARLAAEAAAKRAAEEAQAAQAPAQPAAAQPAAAPQAAQPQAPRQVAPPPTQAAPAQRTKRPPPPAPPPSKFLDRLCWAVFVAMCVATCLILLTVDTFFSGTPKTVVRLVLGTMFVISAVSLFTNALQAKDRVLTVITRKLWGLEQPTTRIGRFMRGFAKDLLTLLGIGWLAIGVYLLLRIVAD
jgi:hypothetical protein